jgi:hypothetical protein
VAESVLDARDLSRRVLAARDALDRAEAIGWLFAPQVRDGFDALDERLGEVLKENLRLKRRLKNV